MSFLEFAYFMHDIANSNIFAAFGIIIVMFAFLLLFLDETTPCLQFLIKSASYNTKLTTSLFMPL